MTSLDDLNARFAVGGVAFDSGFGGLPRATVRTAACEADVYLHGAHVTHFQPTGHKPVLFLSGHSAFTPERPIRGGVPVIFPWFGPLQGQPDAPMHGLVRAMEWEVEDVRRHVDSVTLRFRLAPETPPHGESSAWPGRCALRYEVTAGISLRLSLHVENRDEKPLRFEEALHTYFAVGDARQIDIEGLQNARFLDKTDNFAEKTQLERELRLTGETDRVYQGSDAKCIIHDEVNARRIVVAKENSRATVVWNPWIAKAAALPDFGDDEWINMVCVETCNVLEDAVEIWHGESHEMAADIAVENV